MTGFMAFRALRTAAPLTRQALRRSRVSSAPLSTSQSRAAAGGDSFKDPMSHMTETQKDAIRAEFREESQRAFSIAYAFIAGGALLAGLGVYMLRDAHRPGASASDPTKVPLSHVIYEQTATVEAAPEPALSPAPARRRFMTFSHISPMATDTPIAV
ncbi:hypothetical protein CXG81DRAFT_18250 [Caulochytrium protostelioides]|uniref:Uncharacterized protein n=1 Tax=Caulochytrium protostelioides TaxID=1555241 RepID=A0A4P9WUS4_9FUNG|nr:hypothetical protein CAUPRSCDRAFT_12071 [Caulochytrium protostelioides]RKP02014.1 hypothetical protein CXG81DRAFT_18250 [Caulochytrium protostelioides]|eukprot:RKP02014.1 hypothetical protein CXG81DRAFT_18250 [Caulochytrium protostelioides]